MRILALKRLENISSLPNKQQAWNDLIGLTTDKNSKVKSWATVVLGSVFSHAPDKQQAGNDLHRLTIDEDRDVRSHAAYALGSVFSQVQDKQRAWNDLQRLANDKYSVVRYNVAGAFISAFFYMPEKQQIWNDLHRLTKDDDNWVRYKAADAVGSVISQVPNKQQAWCDLHRLINDENSAVRSRAAYALGSAFSQVPDKFKQQAWNDLIGLTNDKDNYVRVFSSHSLGRVCIFKASQAEKNEDYRKELENAIEFFEVAAQESSEGSNPAKFCLPFYRSFYTIIFKKQEEAKDEVNEYLAEAKATIEGSESKELLCEAIENLAKALEEVQNLGSLDLQGMKYELDSYRKYLELTVELLINAGERAFFATKMIIKGLPILDENIKRLIEEIQEKAKNTCKESKGTDVGEIACAVDRGVQQWGFGSQEEMTQNVEGLIEIFRLKMPNLPGYEQIFREIEGIRNEKDVAKQCKIISRLIGLIPIFSSMPGYVVQTIKEIKDDTTDTKVKLNTMDQKLDEIKELRNSVDILIASIDELQNPEQYLDTIKQDLAEIKNDIPEMKETIYKVLDELASPFLSTTQKLKISIPIIPSLISYETETNVPKLVAEKIHELKNLILSFKGYGKNSNS